MYVPMHCNVVVAEQREVGLPLYGLGCLVKYLMGGGNAMFKMLK